MSTNLDFNQVIQRAYDEAANRIRVDAELTASIIAPPGLEVSIQAADDNIAIRNSTNNDELFINPDGSINVVATITGSAGGTSEIDKATFTYGTTQYTPIGGAYQDTSPTLTAGQGGVARLTEYRALHTNLRDSSGVEFGTSGNPFNVANVTNVISSTAVLTQVSASTSSQTILASNPARKGFILFNNSTSNCYVAFAATASSAAFTIFLNGSMTYQNEAIIYTGDISAIWVSATGELQITELT